MEEHKPKSVKRIILHIMAGILVACSILLVVSVGVQKISGKSQIMVLGWGGATILTGSMEPNIPVGSLIIIHEEDTYHMDDVITYIDEYGRSVTHRVTGLDGDFVVTKGDANNTADKPFHKSQIVGRVTCVVPGVGKVMSFMQEPLVLGGFVVIICLCWLLPCKNLRKVEDELVKAQKENEHCS